MHPWPSGQRQVHILRLRIHLRRHRMQGFVANLRARAVSHMYIISAIDNPSVGAYIWVTMPFCPHSSIHSESCKPYVRMTNTKATVVPRAVLNGVWEDDCDSTCCSSEWCYGFNYEKTTQVIGCLPISNATIQ